MESLTQRQRQILDYIKKHVRTKGYPPSVREIGEAVGLSSSSTVHGHLERMEQKGFIRRDPTKPRAILVLGDPDFVHKEVTNVPVVGRVTAGEPILAVQNIDDYFPVPKDFIAYEDTFILKVRGDSMINAGIVDGDYVVVKQQSYADNGDIAVVLLEDEATVKRFFRQNDHVRLQPENPNLKPILVKDAQILGRVVGLFRRLQ
ncbi:MAG: transcriptional repressor LexA [Firmicutes bacterium]|nr:transcriptional repressor LexA [Bacillota bacterium]